MQFSRPLAVVTPTLDGPVLTALAVADGPFTTGQLTRILGQGSEEGIRKVLRRLTAQGIVSAERVGPAFAYRLNRAHLAAEPIIALAGLRGTFLTRLERLLASWAQPPAYAAVFGSAGRGTMRPDSHIDLLLVRSHGPHEMWDAQLEHLVSTASGWTGNDLRPLVYTLTELDAARGEPVLLDILDSGITVAGERSWFQRRVRPRRAR
ncbi:MAG: nucleotidyltransferase domain-containing protein [Intrasporangium sp.]|uniref:nucleotidyltransferase domain-containing protein n=1 Tax=Intrasporangium sp. TaxID=1925024 RepID=UPI002648CFC3|nr:nucleotidyltransferase domain-containing protein [Intrasporangium sp.]MDN5798186.1 nucleotidyltransferase domain-containing protein [Intrasporangium sp.]